jgi:hypothetical protein
MKKLAIVIILAVTTSLSFAQEQGDMRIQLAGDYRLITRISNEFGANAGFEYVFLDAFSIAPNFTYWFPQFGGRQTNLNIDLRYYLTEGISQVYLLGGYNNVWENFQPGLPGEVRQQSGANFGVGAFLDVTPSFGIITEFKLQSQNTRNQIIRIGLAFKL